jgi:hypothetical protein
LDPSSFLRAVQRTGRPFEVHFAHAEVIAQDTLFSFVVDAHHLYDLF